MNEQYLWDGSGETDPEIAQLEATLGRLRYRPRAKQRMRGMVFAAAAAAIVLAATGLWIFRTSVQFSSWQISGQRLRVGQQIETAGSGAVLESETTGRVEVDAGSRLRLIEPETFSLERGTIHALIWARPQTFVVETPAARTIDLGCQYTLRVERDGAGMLRVETGWVAIVRRGSESFIPAGAVCRTTPDRGPGTPWFEDASPAFAAAIQQFDSGDESALQRALNSARPRDAFSLWHLMKRVNGAERLRVFDRFSQLAHMPAGVTRAAIERGDADALDRAWEALDLGSASWWRGWERRW